MTEINDSNLLDSPETFIVTLFFFFFKAIVGPKGYQLKIVKLLEYPPRQQIYIELKDRLRKKSNYTLSIRWYSRLVHEPEGFYVDEYDTSGFQR